MKKHSIIFAFALALICATSLNAQQNPLQHGKFNVSAGVGLVPTFVADGAETNTPPITLRVGYHISKNFNLTAFAGYSSTTSNSPYLVSDGQLANVTNKQFMTGLRGEVRKDFEGKFDIYGGGLMGYNHTNRNEFDAITGEAVVREVGAPTPFDPNESEGKFLYAGFVGGTYYIQNGIGIFAEAGYGVSLFQTGITFRM